MTAAGLNGMSTTRVKLKKSIYIVNVLNTGLGHTGNTFSGDDNWHFK